MPVELFSTPKWFNKAEAITEVVNMTAEGVRNATQFAEEVGVAAPNGLNWGIQATAVLYAGNAIFAIPNIIKNVHQAFTVQAIVQKIIHVARAILSVGTLGESFAFSIEGVRAVGVIAK